MNDIEKRDTDAYVVDASAPSPKFDEHPEYDAVFGEMKEGQVNYRSVGWSVGAVDLG